MKRKLQFLIFCLTFLSLSYVKAQDLRIHQTHLTDDHSANNLRNLEELTAAPIKLQKFYLNTYYGLFAQFGDNNPYTPLILNMRSGATWINNKAYYSRNYNSFNCSESKTCHLTESLFKLQEGDQNIEGDLVKELMNVAGLRFPNVHVIVRNDLSAAGQNAHPGQIGLSFTASNPKIAPLTTSFANIAPSFSLYIDNNEGELIFGRFDEKKAENKFQNVPLISDETSDFVVTVKSISLSGQKLDNLKAAIDISTPFIVVPPAIMTKVKDEITSKKLFAEKVAVGEFGDLSIDCKALVSLEDLVLELEGTTLRVPASSYVRVHRGVKSDGSDSGCFLSLIPWDQNEKKIILGEPFLKTFYTYFNSKAKNVGFSKSNAAGVTYIAPPTSSPFIGIFFLILIVGGLYWFMKKYSKPGVGGVAGAAGSLFNQGTRLGGGTNATAGRDRWRHQELSDSLGDHEGNA